ncbi:MAG: hypothetical protein M5R36_17255 [Deltaproteobacteria bacterium]|nr:hypothetical protein [Deltaproteobacteria bacterium]
MTGLATPSAFFHGHKLSEPDKLAFEQFYSRTNPLDLERLKLLHGFLEKQYFSEADRRKTLDERARHLLSALLTLVAVFLGGSLISDKTVPDILLVAVSLFLFVTIVSTMFALWPQGYAVPQQHNILNKQLLTTEESRDNSGNYYQQYIVYLAWEYYQCWMGNHRIDDTKAVALKYAYSFLTVTCLFLFEIILLII